MSIPKEIKPASQAGYNMRVHWLNQFTSFGPSNLEKGIPIV
jgi:hypothetical protein